MFMAVIVFDPKLSAKFDAYNKLEKNWISRIVTWLIDWKYRRTVALSGWLKEQVDKPSLRIVEVADSIPNYDNLDIQTVNVLKYVYQNIGYQSDVLSWNMEEYWQTADETVRSGKGDCEDGAILTYVLCRLKGVPANRLMIFAGDVEGGGHCWLGYRPSFAPLNFAFLDWCFWYDSRAVIKRDLFTVIDQNIYEYEYYNGEYLPSPMSDYLKLWVAFNEDKSNTGIKYEVGGE